MSDTLIPVPAEWKKRAFMDATTYRDAYTIYSEALDGKQRQAA